MHHRAARFAVVVRAHALNCILELAREVVSEDASKHVELVPDLRLDRHVAHVAVRLELGKNALLRTPCFVEEHDLAWIEPLVGHDDLELVSVLDGLKEVELDGCLVLASEVLSDEDEAIASAPRLRLPAPLEVAEPAGLSTCAQSDPRSASNSDPPGEVGRTYPRFDEMVRPAPFARPLGPEWRVFVNTTERTVNDIRRVGIDLAKKVFHVTAVDANDGVVERKRLRRTGLQAYLLRLPEGCVVAMEACGSAHHWGRLAMRLGHEVRLMSPQFVVPYVKSNKNDINDADAIVEASSRPSMRFVGVKSVPRQHIQQVNRARQLAVKERTAHCNQLHGFLLEYGVEAPKGVRAVLRRVVEVLEDAENELCVEARALLSGLGEELRRLDERVMEFDARIARIGREAPACRRLEAIPGIGPLTSTALLAAVGDAREFRNGRELSAWLGDVAHSIMLRTYVTPPVRGLQPEILIT